MYLNQDTLSHIYNYCRPIDMLYLMQTSKFQRDYFSQLFLDRIGAAIQKRIPLPLKDFYQALQTCNAWITGSIMLEILYDETYSDADMDIIIRLADSFLFDYRAYFINELIDYNAEIVTLMTTVGYQALAVNSASTTDQMQIGVPLLYCKRYGILPLSSYTYTQPGFIDLNFLFVRDDCQEFVTTNWDYNVNKILFNGNRLWIVDLAAIHDKIITIGQPSYRTHLPYHSCLLSQIPARKIIRERAIERREKYTDRGFTFLN